jgi:hypothetical protein
MLNTSFAERVSDETSDCAEQYPHSTHTPKRRRLMPVETSQADLCEQGSIIRTEDVPALKNADMETSPDNMFALFNRAIILSSVSTPNARSSAYEATVASVFMYNIGLVYHRDGIERGCSALLRKALNAYERARKSLHKSQAGSIFDLILFALLNNMGHIHSHFFDKQEADACRRCLYQNYSKCSRILSKEDFAFFFMNILVMKADLLQFAPAA